MINARQIAITATLMGLPTLGMPGPPTMLGIEGTQFTINGSPRFLLGFSYYGGLGASEEFVTLDLDDMQARGFNWLRVWATWAGSGADVSAVDSHGHARQPYLNRLAWLVGECDRRGMIVDVTLTRGKGAGSVADLPAHREAVRTIIGALQGHANWYLDLANERDVRDARYVSVSELRELRQLAAELAPKLLVTASFGGHDLDEASVREALFDAKLDFLCPHRPRHADSPQQTESETRKVLAAMKTLGVTAPVHYQEPFRRGYSQWEPIAEDFLIDLRGAVRGGAAGWCFHNGSQRRAVDNEPRRSFDMRARRLFDQLDDEERKVVDAAGPVVMSAGD
ncbi:MAG: hypothetical protein HPY44_11300 [Armatimonadetes bacterium]|nr:hypothetical protein [Armatimonadota bacterium]